MAALRQCAPLGRQHWFHAILCTAAAVALVESNGGIWTNLGGHDLHAYFLTRYEYAAESVRAGRIPLWSPEQFCGAPFFASPQSGTLYAPVQLVFSLLPVRAALQALWALHVLLFFSATLAYLSDRGVAAPARIAGAFVGLGGILHGPGSGGGLDQPQFFAGAAWFPALLLCWDRAQRRGLAPWLGLLSLAVAGQWFSGYPDIAMDTAVVLGVIALLHDGSTLARRVGTLVVGFTIGTALAGAQLLALAEAVRESVRADEVGIYASVRAAVFAVHSLPRLGERLLAHHGAAALALATIAILRPTRARYAWLAAFLWTLFALNAPLAILYRIPPFSESRFPVGWGYIGPILFAFLVATGLHAGWRHRLRLVRAAALVAGLLAVMHAGRTLWGAPHAGRRPAPDYDLIAQRVPVLERVRAGLGRDVRVLSQRERFAGAHLRYGLPTPGGYDPLAPRRIQHLLKEMAVPLGTVTEWSHFAEQADLASLLGLGIVVAPPTAVQSLRAAGFVPRTHLPPDDVVMSRRSVPRARLVHRVVVVGSDEERPGWIAANASEAPRVAVLEAAPPIVPSEPPASAVETVDITTSEPERVVVRALLASPGLLVLTDTWYPGWVARVNGLPTPVLRADHAFRAVALPAGEHQVEFSYAPTWLLPGALLALAGTAFTLVFLLPPMYIRIAALTTDRGVDATVAGQP